MNKQISILYIFFDFLQFIIDIIQFLSIFFTFYITLFRENTLFSEKKAPAGKRTHGKTFLRIFLQKKAPAGKCTHGKNIFNNFEDFNNSKRFLMILLNFNITNFQKKVFLQKKGPCGKMHTRQKSFRHFSRKKKPLREDAHTAK